MYRTFEREGLDNQFTSEALYSAFIQSAVRVGKIDVVERMLRMMIRNRITPSTELCHSTLKMLSSRRHFSSCVHVFVTYGDMLPNDKIIFSCLINAALESNMLDKAVLMLSRYQQCDLETSDYVTAFRTCVATGSVDLAEKLFLDLKQKAAPLMLNLALLVCINGKQPERAMMLLVKAHKFEAVPSTGGAENSKALHIVDTVSYNTVIKGFVVEGNFESCCNCLRSMQMHNLEPDDVTLTSLLEISLMDKTYGMTDQLVKMLLEKGHGQSLEPATCNLFLKHLIRASHLEKAMEVYQALKDASQPSIATYSIVIKALVDSHDMERALLILSDMLSAGTKPDEIIFTHLLEGCRLVNNHKLGERLFEDMLSANVHPSEYTLTMMVKLHGRCGAHEKAYQLVESWEKQHGMKPTVIHYTCVMSGCLRSKAYGQAWAAYQLMVKRGVRADDMMMSTLLPAMVAAQAFDRVLQLARDALQRPRGIKVPGAALNSALSQMEKATGFEQETQEMRLLMQGAGLPVAGRARK